MVNKIIKETDYLYGRLSNWRSYWSDLADFALPRKANINTPRLQGDRLRFGFLYDSTAIISLQIMAAGFHSNLTNPSSKWFSMSTRDPRFMDNYDVRMWFKTVEDLIFSTLNNTNFDTVMQEFYMDAGCFGTGCILTEEDWKDKVRFTSVPVEQIVITEDANGRVDKMRRCFQYTIEQAYGLWGARAGKSVVEKIESKPYDELEIIHYVAPREKRDLNKEDSINMPFESVWVNKTDKVEVKRSGYLEFPYSVGRFYKDAKEACGYSPVMNALSWVKLINAQAQTVLRAGMKQTDPALIAPSSGFILPFNLNPGYVNIYDPSQTDAKSVAQIPNGGNLPITLEIMQMTQQAIEKALFVPLFRALADITKQMTIEEVQRRVAENMVLLGPVVGRFTQELISPILERTFKILYRRGEIPEVPQVIKEQELDFVYLSPLAKAQKASELSSITNFLTISSSVATVLPQVLDKINGDKVIDIVAQVEGVDPEIINSDETVKGIRDQRQQAEAAQMQLAMAEQGSKVVQNATQADKNMRTDAGNSKK